MLSWVLRRESKGTHEKVRGRPSPGCTAVVLDAYTVSSFVVKVFLFWFELNWQAMNILRGSGGEATRQNFVPNIQHIKPCACPRQPLQGSPRQMVLSIADLCIYFGKKKQTMKHISQN